MNIKELKKEARNSLKGRVVEAFGLMILSMIISSLINVVIPGIGTIVMIVFSIPCYIGIIGEFMHFTKKENVSGIDFIKIGINNFIKSWLMFFSILGRVIVQMIFKSILIMILGAIVEIIIENIINMFTYVNIENIASYIVTIIIMMAFYIEYTKYALAKYIMIDKENSSVKEIVEESKKIMNGKRREYLLLQLSFIGWYIPSVIMLVMAFILAIRMIIEPIATGNLLTFFTNAVIGGLLVILTDIYISFIQPYRTIASIEFYNKYKQE